MMNDMNVKISTRGRITIPIDIRRRFGWTAGTQLIVREVDERIVVMTFAQYVRSLRGMFKGRSGLKLLAEDRARESHI